ncbi:MAG: DUF1007 family protein [Roseicyclus sp.]
MPVAFGPPPRIPPFGPAQRAAARALGLAMAAALLTHLAAARPATAHPHVFIDAGLTLFTAGNGTVDGVEVTWRYDEFYSLILLQDFALDRDFDGRLTEAETAAALGFDLEWNSGFDGGLNLRRGDVALGLGRPEPVSLRLLEDGRLESVHRRPVTGDPGGPAPVEARIYDAAFYVAFDAVLPSGVSGTDCVPERVPADLEAAQARLDAALMAMGGAVAAEDDFPRLGGLFADALVFSCAR